MIEDDFAAPIMPTGSGVADLEITREQAAVARDDVEQSVSPDQAQTDEAAGGSRAGAEAESEAHPS